MTRPRRRLGRWVRRRGPELLFGLTLLTLTALVTRWAVFIHGAVQVEYQGRHELLRWKARALAAELGRVGGGAPRPGPLAEDAELELVASGEAPPGTPTLAPAWPDWAVQPVRTRLAEIEHRFGRRMFMIAGEGGLLALLLVACSAMLYRVVRVQQRAARERREFWGRVTHEIKTPITGIKAFLQTLRAQPMDRATMVPMVELALHQVERQQRLAENLLVGQRLERPDGRLNPERVELPRFLQTFVDGHRPDLGAARVVLSPPPDGLPAALADPAALHVILDNLVDNALKYAGPAAVLQLAVRRAGNGLAVRFADDGAGFDPARAEDIFEAYRRLPGELPGVRHGTGLGLHIARRLARAMGGDLVAASAGPGRGAEFTLTVPAAPP